MGLLQTLLDKLPVSASRYQKLEREADELARQVNQLQSNLNEVDDHLICSCISVGEGGYKKAIHDLISWNICVHDDPGVSKEAKKRLDWELAMLEQVRELTELVDMAIAESPYPTSYSLGIKLRKLQEIGSKYESPGRA